jgi:hypothetical protein
MGGLCFSLNTIWSQVVPYVATYVYSTRQNYASSSSCFSKEELQSALIVLTTIWGATAAIFAFTIKRDFWGTFYSIETASQYVIRLFRETANDEGRFAAAFKNHRSYAAPIESEVRQWISERYATWQVERPAWFTEAAISNIPDDMMPREALQDILEKGGGMRRRSSIGERIGGSSSN